MAPQAAQNNRNDAWRISRCFEGDKSPEELLRALFDSPTTDAGVELLKEAGLLEPVMASIAQALEEQLKRRAGSELEIEAVFFSNQYGILGKTSGADRLLALHRV